MSELQLGGLIALANKQAPALNLPLHGVEVGDYYKNLYTGMLGAAQLQQQYASQANQLNIAQAKEQGLNNRAIFDAQNQANLQNQRLAQEAQLKGIDQAIQQQQVNQQGDYQQGLLGVRQGELGVNAQRLGLDQNRLDLDTQRAQQQADYQNKDLAIKQAQVAVQQRSELSKERINQLGAAASAYLISASQISDPQKLQEFTNSYADQMVAKGLYTKDQADQFKSLPPQQQQNMVMQDLTVTQAADLLKTKLGAMPGTIEVNSGGSTVKIVPNTPQQQTDLQKQSTEIQQKLAAVKDLQDNFDAKYLTAEGQQKLGAINFADRYGSEPIVGGAIKSAVNWYTGMPPEKQQQFAYDANKYLDKTEDFFLKEKKDTAGTRFALQQIEMMRQHLINKDMGPNQFKAGMDSIWDKYYTELGVVNSSLNSMGTSTSMPSSADKYGFSNDDYANTAKASGRSIEDVKKAVAMGLFKKGNS